MKKLLSEAYTLFPTQLDNPLSLIISLILLALLAVAILFLRRRYLGYLQTRLLFQPWVNMTNNEELNIGTSLSEILFFELEDIQEIHRKSRLSRGLWNEKHSIPVFEQTRDGKPDFLSKVKLLGVSGKFGTLLRFAHFFVFFAQPVVLKGSIHKYGPLIRLQVTLDGRRNSSGQVGRSQCWKVEDEHEDLSKIPQLVSKLAHMIYMKLADNNGCKTPESFDYLTQGLGKHLEYDTLKDEIGAEEAIKLYEQAIAADNGKNAMASYNIATIRYSRYKHDDNEAAIRDFLDALHTSSSVLRAQAYSGLANALCQKFQRHKRGDESTLTGAIRYGEYAYEIDEAKGIAAIVKALAYVWQVVNEAEMDKSNNGERTARSIEAFDNAECFYAEAIKLNKEYTIAHNNLGYLYFYMAKKEKEKREMLLRKAEQCYLQAIKFEPTYFDAYDNLGQIYMQRKHYNKSMKYYYTALDYKPGYFATHEHLSHLFLHMLSDLSESETERRSYLARKAIDFHGEALAMIEGETKKIEDTCNEFRKVFEDRKLDLGAWVVPKESSERLEAAQCVCYHELVNQNKES